MNTWNQKSCFFVLDSKSIREVKSALYGYVLTPAGFYDDYLDGELDGDGCYVRITVDEEKIKIEQDANGSFGLYLYEAGGYFALSNSFFMLQDFLKTRVPLSLNYDYVYQFLALDLCSLAYDETAINEIKLIDRSAEIFINKQNGDINIIRRSECANIIPLELGLEVLDQWFEKWTNILHKLTVRTNRLSINLSGGFDSRLTFLLALSSGCNLNSVRIFSMIDRTNKVHVEDYRIASRISDKFGFVLNNKDFQLGRKSNFPVEQIIDLAFDTKMSFHKKVYFRDGRFEDPLYQLPGAGGELIRKYWDMTSKEIIEQKGHSAALFDKSISKMVQEAIERVLARSIRQVCKKFGICEESPKVGHYLYRETRCRFHFGKAMAEDVAQGVYWLAPLLDKEFLRLETRFIGSNDDNGLIALIFARYCPELLLFPFEGNRSIDYATIEKAKRLCKDFKYERKNNISGTEVFHLLGKVHAKYSTSVVRGEDVDDYFKRVVLSSATKRLIEQYFPPQIYDWAIAGIGKTGFVSSKSWHAMTAIAKILDNLETNSRVFSSNKMSLDNFLCDKGEIMLPSERIPSVRVLKVRQNSKVVISGSILDSDRHRNKAVLLRVNFATIDGGQIKTGRMNWSEEYGDHMFLNSGLFMYSFVAPTNAAHVEVSISRFNCSDVIRVVDYSVEIQPSDILIPASIERYNWRVAVKNILPGKQYEFEAQEVVVEAGTTAFVEAIIYEAQSRKYCLRKKFPICDAHISGIRWRFAVPSAEGDYSLLLYAGIAGGTDGIGVSYRNVRVTLIPCGMVMESEL